MYLYHSLRQVNGMVSSPFFVLTHTRDLTITFRFFLLIHKKKGKRTQKDVEMGFIPYWLNLCRTRLYSRDYFTC